MLNLKRALPFAALLATASFANAQYSQVNLASDGTIAAAHTNPSLVNAWGIAFSPTGPFWINENGSGLSQVFDGAGNGFPANNQLSVTVPPLSGSAPTGIVFNSTTGFTVSNGTVTAPSVFIFVTEDGVISGWNPTVDPTNGVVAVTSPASTSVYKGAALATDAQGDTFLYATNFHEGMVDVFDSNWNLVNSFTDAHVPAGYAPFGIANVSGLVVVTFALQDAAMHDDVSGPGHGFVDVFRPNGTLVRRLISRGALNSPWGIAVAPHNFGEFHDHLLIGNFGDGKINAFDMPSGHFDGPLRQTGAGHHPIVIDGLWGLIVGNGGRGGDRNKLYFTAGPGGESHGLFGYIQSNHGH